MMHLTNSQILTSPVLRKFDLLSYFGGRHDKHIWLSTINTIIDEQRLSVDVIYENKEQTEFIFVVVFDGIAICIEKHAEYKIQKPIVFVNNVTIYNSALTYCNDKNEISILQQKVEYAENVCGYWKNLYYDGVIEKAKKEKQQHVDNATKLYNKIFFWFVLLFIVIPLVKFVLQLQSF